MKWRRNFAIVGAMSVLATGCQRGDPREKLLASARNKARYELIAKAVVVGDTLEYWKEPKEDHFGRLLVVARNKQERLIDFCEGRFVSYPYPFFQNERYAVLVAGSADGKTREAFLVYDGLEKKFRVHRPQLDCHVHDGIVIVGDRVFFSSCKTPKPVGAVNLNTGVCQRFGLPAEQSARFHVEDEKLFLEGQNDRVCLLKDDELELQPKGTPLGAETRMNFDDLRVPIDRRLASGTEGS